MKISSNSTPIYNYEKSFAFEIDLTANGIITPNNRVYNNLGSYSFFGTHISLFWVEKVPQAGLKKKISRIMGKMPYTPQPYCTMKYCPFVEL